MDILALSKIYVKTLRTEKKKQIYGLNIEQTHGKRDYIIEYV